MQRKYLLISLLLAATNIAFAENGLETKEINTEKPQEKKPRITTLRVEGTPMGKFRRYGAGLPTLDTVEILVRNVGSEVANSVVVNVVLPDDTILPLEGPTTLKRNQKGTYTASVNKKLNSNAPLKAKLECTNCRKG